MRPIAARYDRAANRAPRRQRHDERRRPQGMLPTDENHYPLRRPRAAVCRRITGG